MKNETNSIKKLARRVHGWLTEDEGELLYSLAKKTSGKGVIVEIGSWKGKSTIWLGKGSKKGKRIPVYAIDPHIGSNQTRMKFSNVSTFTEFKKNIKNAHLDDIVTSIVKTSEKAAKKFNKKVELIFIDGDHKYRLVKLDFDLWFPKIINGGIMAFHDTIEYHGPKKVVEEQIFKSTSFKNIRFLDSITYAEKVEINSVKDRLLNRYILLLKKIDELVQKAYLPRGIRRLWERLIILLQQ